MDVEDSVDESTAFFTQEEVDDRSEEISRDKSDIASSSSLSKGSRKGKKDGEGGIVNTENEVDDDDDDDDSSVGSSSSSQSNSSLSSTSSTSSEASLTLVERQARNIARNERFLGSLREKYKDQLGTQQQRTSKTKRKGTKDHKTDDSSDGDGEEGRNFRAENLGMVREGTHRLFSLRGLISGEGQKDISNDSNTNLDEYEALARSYRNLASGLKALEHRYPHRQAQIGRLYALVSSTVSVTPSTDTVAKVQPAYIDCSIVEPSTVERLVYMIYKQLKPSSSMVPDDKAPKSKRIKRRHRKKRKRLSLNTSSHQGSKVKAGGEEIKDGANDEVDTHPTAPNKPQHQREEEDETNQPRVLPSRRAKKAAIHKSLASNAMTYENVQRNRTEDAADDDTDNDTDDDEGDSDEEGVTTIHSAVLNLGRSLQKHYGSYIDDNGAIRNRSFRKKPRCGILILDKAEELLSLSAASKRGTSTSGGGGGADNYLSELLLLPKIMKLNLTVIVVTNYYNLHMTRLNNAAGPSKALGTISNGIHPIIVQFPAYKGNKMFTEILSTAENQRLVLGDSLTSPANASLVMRQSLKDKLVRSFWNTIVQFASDATRDLRDFRRLGRSLWPSFLAPLHPSVLRTTLGGAAHKLGIEGGLTRAVLSDPAQYSRIEDEVVRRLGTKFYARVAALAAGDESLTLLTLNGGRIAPNPILGVTESVPQPYLRSCLLLAAFVCQHNKADRDRQIFSAVGNGKRRKSRANDDIYGGNDEDVAFGSTSAKSGATRQQPRQVEELRSLKLRPVPLERIFSVFTTLVRLNPQRTQDDSGSQHQATPGGDQEEAAMEDLGSSRLYRDLAHLIDLGYLHLARQQNQSSSSHLAPSKILCTLAREEAVEISGRIGIPLERYLL